MSDDKHRYVKLPVYDPAVQLMHPAPIGAIYAMVSAFEKNYGPHGIHETMLAVYNALMKFGKPVERTHE